MSKFAPVFEVLGPVFKAHKFRKSGSKFYRVSDETLVVFNFRGKSSGNVFYVEHGERPFEAVEGAKAPSGSDLKVGSMTPIRLFKNADGWLYEMAEVERAILSRKIEEQIASFDGTASQEASK